jgi:hypothetical protein
MPIRFIVMLGGRAAVEVSRLIVATRGNSAFAISVSAVHNAKWGKHYLRSGTVVVLRSGTVVALDKKFHLGPMYLHPS